MKGYKRAMDFQGESVHPVQFHGIELKPWAAKVAELVLWIGYLQWQVTAGRFQAMREPLIQDLHHIECRDALITWKKAEAVVDENGEPVRRPGRDAPRGRRGSRGLGGARLTADGRRTFASATPG